MFQLKEFYLLDNFIDHFQGKNSAQTDEEKQRERQRNEREQKNAELGAQNIKREREAREARLLDREIRHYQAQETKKQKAAAAAEHHKQSTDKSTDTQAHRLAKGSSSERTSSASTPPSKSIEPPPITFDRSRDSIERTLSSDVERSTSEHKEQSTILSEPISEQKEIDLGTVIVPDSVPDSLVEATCHLSLDTVIKTLPLEEPTARDDSTESEHSLIAYSQSEAYKIFMCRAPIASLDCMEEFNGTGGHLDFGRSISLGSNAAIPLRHGGTLTPGLRYKNLGKSGLRISNVGLGTWPVFSPGVSEEQADAIIKLAIESGINIFDISEAHSEVELGKVINRAGWKRSSYVITTKVYWSTKSEERGLSRKHIIECVKASLQRLQLSYIDVVIIYKADTMCPMEEVVRAMTYIIQQGWAMYWGTSRWSQIEIMEAYTNCRQFNCVTPIVEQAEYHMFCREKCELYLPEMYNKIGVGLMAWGPLSMALGDTQNGERLLFSKASFKSKSQSYSWTEDDVNKNGFGWVKDKAEVTRRQSDRVRDLATLAEKLGCSTTQLSIAWSLKHEPVQCLLLGATTAEQLHQSLQALQLLPRLSTSVMLELERILENKPIRPPAISTLALR